MGQFRNRPVERSGANERRAGHPGIARGRVGDRNRTNRPQTSVSGNGIDITAAIWFHAGRLPTLRTLGSALLSVLIVGMGVSLGREGAPKQADLVNFLNPDSLFISR
jgi:hypothetical protein